LSRLNQNHSNMLDCGNGTNTKATMRSFLPNTVRLRSPYGTSQQGRASVVLLVAVSFALGITVGVFSIRRTDRGAISADRESGGNQAGTLSVETNATVKPLTSPAKAAAPPFASAAAFDAADIEEVRRAVPNFTALSLEEGTRVLRQKALEEFSTVAREMESQVKEAQQRLGEAQRGNSGAEQQAAMKHLQQVQAEQAEKLKAIAARAQARIAALESLKK